MLKACGNRVTEKLLEGPPKVQCTSAGSVMLLEMQYKLKREETWDKLTLICVYTVHVIMAHIYIVVLERLLGCSDGTVVRALTSHQCGLGSIPRLSVICGLSLLALYSAPRGFSPGTPVFPSPQKPTFDLH